VEKAKNDLLELAPPRASLTLDQKCQNKLLGTNAITVLILIDPVSINKKGAETKFYNIRIFFESLEKDILKSCGYIKCPPF
jgi:hypothetical protein